MNGSTLQKTAADCAEDLPGTRMQHPFGPGGEVLKVGGKVFMLLSEAPGRPVVILKADPGDVHALREQYRLVVARLPRAAQPVAPHTYGTCTRTAP
jgi:predicted DNA-binding protein (MmcQ/YjbR family)